MNYTKLLTKLSIIFLVIPSIIYWSILYAFNIQLSNNAIGYIALFSILTNLEILTIAFITASGVNKLGSKVKEYEEKFKKDFISSIQNAFTISGFGQLGNDDGNTRRI